MRNEKKFALVSKCLLFFRRYRCFCVSGLSQLECRIFFFFLFLLVQKLRRKFEKFARNADWVDHYSMKF